jgi:hypothetical protein
MPRVCVCADSHTPFSPMSWSITTRLLDFLRTYRPKPIARDTACTHMRARVTARGIMRGVLAC